MTTDSEIIGRSGATPSAFGELYDRHAPAIYRYAARRADLSVAEDVMSETFLVAFERRGTFDHAWEDARPWLYGIATNVLHRYRRSVAVMAIIVAGNVVGVENVVGIDSPLGDDAAPATAAEVLEAAAQATIQTSDPVVGWGQYLKIVSTSERIHFLPEETDGDDPADRVAYTQPYTATYYIPADYQADVTIAFEWGDRTAIFGVDAAERVRAYSELAGTLPSRVFTLPRNRYGPEVASLPRDPQKLYDHFAALEAGDGGASPEFNAMSHITRLLISGEVSADMRAVMYETLALVPGMEIVDESSTIDGMAGIALGRDDEAFGRRYEVVIDPNTGLFLGEREILLADDGPVPAGTEVMWVSRTFSVVDEAPTQGQ